ncbi:hypothetical protein [Nonomuraea fuscirosea]|uniref:hypothetical protein n=1 Tax=Nonomuraea fuscirosea TaxID=1291556 RepID=UPI000D0586AC|nr:hypothetical protein [Nonomuraea fuscirosea]
MPTRPPYPAPRRTRAGRGEPPRQDRRRIQAGPYVISVAGFFTYLLIALIMRDPPDGGGGHGDDGGDGGE